MNLNNTSFISSIIAGVIVWIMYRNYTASPHEKYSTFWPRFWSPSIDQVILWVPTMLVPYAIHRFLNLEGEALRILYGFIYCIPYLYTMYFHGVYGATIGKMATKIRVVDVITEQSITIRQAVIRDSIPFLITIIIIIYEPLSGDSMLNGGSNKLTVLHTIYGLWFLAEIVTMLTNTKRRALHDFLAGTVVIRSTIRHPSKNSDRNKELII